MGNPLAGSHNRARHVKARGDESLAIRAERHRATESSWIIGLPMGKPLATFHSLAVLSLHPVTTILPSGLNAATVISS